MTWQPLEDMSLLKTKDKVLCICHCGKFKKVLVGNLNNNKSKSCGCSRKKTETKESHRLYSTWKSMKTRCLNPNCGSYKYYGGKGVKVCERWMESFENFLEDMENTFEEGLTLDRIDVDGDYSPNNCRWADSLVQANNTGRDYTKIFFEGEYFTEAELSRITRIKRSTLQSRRLKGWSDFEIVNGKESPTTYYVDGRKFNQKSLADYLGISPQVLNKRFKGGKSLEEVISEFK